MSSNLIFKLMLGIFMMMVGAGCCTNETGCPEKACAPCEALKTPTIACDTVYYITGPQQASPPDGEFKAGTAVEVLGDAGSYILVRAMDGRQGYVSTNAVTIPK